MSKSSTTASSVSYDSQGLSDITDPFQFESALYGGLDYLLSAGDFLGVQPPKRRDSMDLAATQRDNPDAKEDSAQASPANDIAEFSLTPIMRQLDLPSPQSTELTGSKLAEEIMTFNDNTNLYPSPALSSSLSYSEENMMLTHFFNKLLPLLDSHPSSPWPELALKYCDFEIARSCFISLSCMHLYESRGENEFYKRGLLHINKTMEYLVNYVKTSKEGFSNDSPENDKVVERTEDPGINVESIVVNLKNDAVNKKRTSFFVILLLIYVHLLFGILESGRSALSRVFLKLFASITEDETFQVVLQRIDQSQTLICVLSWFDTIAAIVSPDCRLPYCNPQWYGTKTDTISTAKMNGCPGEIFNCIAQVCKLRADLKKGEMRPAAIVSEFERIKNEILNYRDYVPLKLPGDTNGVTFEYEERLRGAQCWSLAVYIKLLEVCKVSDDYLDVIQQATREFVFIYDMLSPVSPICTQMVWPIFIIGCHCERLQDRNKFRKYMETLYQTVQMGTVMTMRKIVEEVWSTGKHSDDILMGKEWLGAGIDYLPY
ncbi:unnamed protein product [Kuraishia capsulata CBS 1993]|uniref:Uncharacterized protein n=1 Tax=Kuraishia capsulata CBS 1993 TaxID=1382522 RepID=W6MJ69_9ASCO|nr:uncharacterized protein KUCA_T00002511001 [Kuraishia capsulata CBS 1993]CDK26539.1 unnamed protein product [Kuraishia capsulata CBS 1993]